MADEVLVRLGANATRRVAAVGALVMLTALLLYLAFATPEAGAIARTVLLMAGVLTALGAMRQWRATNLWLELTDQVLRDSAGRVLVEVSQIKSVDRGSFAFKPSNGFLIITEQPLPLAWAPGLWWRIGRRIGVGGVCAASDARVMADAIAVLKQTR